MDETVRHWCETFHRSVINEDGQLSGLRAVFGVLSTPTPNDELQDFRKDGIMKMTMDTLRVMAKHCPSEAFLCDILECIKSSLESKVPHIRKAACLAIAVLASEPEDPETNIFWKPCLDYFLKGLADPHPVVQNAALYTLDLFGNILFKVGVEVYSKKVYTPLKQCFDTLSKTRRRRGADLPMLPHLSELFIFVAGHSHCAFEEAPDTRFRKLFLRLMDVFSSDYPIDVRKAAFRAIKDALRYVNVYQLARFIPYYGKHLHKFVDTPLGSETLCLQLDVISDVKEIFDDVSIFYHPNIRRHLAWDILILLEKTFDKVNTKTAVRTNCSLLGCLHTCLEEEVADLVEQVVTKNLEILKEEDEDDNNKLPDRSINWNHNESSRSVDSDDDDGGDDRVFPSNSAGRKERACLIFKYLSKYCVVPALRRHFDVTFKQLMETAVHREPRVRVVALKALSYVCDVLDDSDLPGVLDTIIIPKYLDVILNDTDEGSMSVASKALTRDYIGLRVASNPSNVEALVHTITQILMSKTKYQEHADNSGRIEEDRIDDCSNFKNMLFEDCLYFISFIGEKMQPEMFATFFQVLFPLLLSKTDSHCHVDTIQSAIGSLKKCIILLSEYSGAYMDQLVPVLMHHARQTDVKTGSTTWRLCHIALSALGACTFSGKNSACPYYPKILQLLQGVLSGETDKVVDEAVCEVIIGMVATDVILVPLEEVLPVLFEKLPIKWYRKDYRSVVACFLVLYEIEHPLMKQNIALVAKVCVSAIGRSKEDSNQETVDGATKLLLSIKTEFPDVFETATKDLKEYQLVSLQKK